MSPDEQSAKARIVPLGPMQRMAAAHMAKSRDETVPVTLFGHADAEALVALRAGLNAEDGETRISVTHILVKAVAQALRAHPMLNAALVERDVHVYEDVNIGVALALPDGNLIVPVIRAADRKPLALIARELAALEAKGRAGKLALDDVRGGTFTLSNAGTVPSARWTTPVIVLPQCAILGLGAIHEAAVARNGTVVARRILPTSLTFDHRIVNGYPASQFVDTLHGLIEAPERVDLGPSP